MATRHSLGSTAPSSSAGGRPPALKLEHIAVLHEIVLERAQANLQDIADELHHRCALPVCAAMIRRALHALGVVRLKPLRRTVTVRAEGAKQYGYTAAHRREAISPYSTNLTDAEWELVADLFERTPGQRGTPVHYSRRDLVNACSYVLRTGCAWRLLPETQACDQLLKRDLGTKQDLAATRNMIARNSTITDEKQVCFLSLR